MILRGYSHNPGNQCSTGLTIDQRTLIFNSDTMITVGPITGLSEEAFKSVGVKGKD